MNIHDYVLFYSFQYLSLKGDIDEVKSLNSEVMEKISLLEKKSEEKKKRRALNRYFNYGTVPLLLICLRSTRKKVYK